MCLLLWMLINPLHHPQVQDTASLIKRTSDTDLFVLENGDYAEEHSSETRNRTHGEGNKSVQFGSMGVDNWETMAQRELRPLLQEIVTVEVSIFQRLWGMRGLAKGAACGNRCSGLTQRC